MYDKEREQIQEGQHLANQIMENIKNEIAIRDLKYVAVETFKEEFQSQFEQHFESVKTKTT